MKMNNDYPTTPVVKLTLYNACGVNSRKAIGVISGVIIPKTTDLSGLRFDNATKLTGSRAELYRIYHILPKVLEKEGHFIYDILKFNTLLGYDEYVISNITMNPMSRLMPGEKELVGRFMTTECLEDRFAMDFDGDFVQILNEGLIQQMLEMNEVKRDDL